MKKAPPVRLSLRKLLVAMLAVGPISILPSPLLAAVPPGTTAPFTVTNGSASWVGSGNLGNITATDRSVLVWNGGAFNIAAGEIFSFQVAGGSVLNKVGYTTTGAVGTPDTAIINGTLNGNGRVIVLANGNIQVGGGAVLQASNGVVLSTLSEADTFTFTTTGNLAATGSSLGSIILGNNTTQVSVLGNLSAHAGSVQPNNLSVSGDLVVNQPGTGAVTLTGANGPTSVNNNLTVMTGGSVGQGVGNLIALGTANFTLSGNTSASINLPNAGNDFGTVVASTGNNTGANVTVRDNNNINLGTSSIGGNLSVTAGGNIATTGAVNVLNNNTVTLNSTGGTINFANNSSVANGTINASTLGQNIVLDVIGNVTTGTLSTGGLSGNVVVTNPGAGYVTAPTVTVSGGGVTGATATATINTTTGTVTAVTITVPPGQFYSSNPTITFNNVNAGAVTTNATATASVASGSITSLALGVSGAGYTSAPTVVFTGGGGTGAQADAVLGTNGEITAFILNNVGTGYTSAPTISFTGGAKSGLPTTPAAAVQSVSGFAAITANSTGVLTVNGPVVTSGGNVTMTGTSINQTTNSTFPLTAATVVFNATNGNVVIGNVTASNLTVTSNNGSISQPTGGIITTGNNTTSTFTAATGNIALTNSNVLNNATLILTGNQVSVTSNRSVTLSNSTINGNLTVSTVPSAFGGGQVTFGSGNGTSAKGVTVGGSLTVLTNGSNVQDDTYANQSVLGSVTVNTIAAGAGVIYDTSVANGGSGYLSAPTVVITGGGGTGGAATATVNSSGAITGLSLSNIGSGYTSAPTISFVGGGAPTTAATATVALNTSVGFLTSITAATPGSGYVSVPTVVITGGGGSGATATAVINTSTNTVTGIFLNNAGTGYTSAPTVTIVGGGNNSITAATVNPVIGAAGNVTFTADIGPNGQINTNYGQWNVVGNVVSLAETQNLNLGNMTTRNLTVNSTAANITFSGNVTTNTLSANANSSSIVQVGALNVSGTSVFRSANSGGTVLENTANVFGGTVQITNGGNNIIVAGSNLTVAGGTSVTGGNLTIRTTDTFNNTITWSNNGNATNVTLNSTGNITMSGGTLRNLTLIAGNQITNGTGFQSNGTLTVTSNGTATLANTSNNLTNVVLANQVGDATISSNRSLTVSGNSTGNVTVTAGEGNLTSFANPWNLVLGNLNVARLTASAKNGQNNSVVGGASGDITQSANSRVHVENTATFLTFNGGNVNVSNAGNSFGRVEAGSGGSVGASTNNTGSIAVVEDGTLKVGNIATTGNASLTSRFGSIIEDTAAAVAINVNGTASVLSLAAGNGSVSLAGTTNSNNTTGNVVAANITALGSAAVQSSGNITLGSTSANSLTVVSGNTIAQSAALKVFALSTFNATNSIALTNAENNFGPVVISVGSTNQNASITEAGTLNLRAVTFPGGGNGTFTATSLNGDIIDTGLNGVRPAGAVNAPSTGVITLTAVNGNIVLDDPTTDLPTSSGVVFNAKNVTLSVLGTVGGTLVLGANNTTSTASGNLTATSALGNIGNAGAMSVGGLATFQTGNGNITIAQPNVGFGSLRFIGNQVSIAEAGNTDILTGSTAYGPAQIVSGGAIQIVDQGGGVVSFGNTVALQAAGNITLSKLQAVGTVTVTSPGTKNLSALSLSADLNSKTPVDAGTGAGPSTDANLAPKP